MPTGPEIRAARLKVGLTQAELAARAGISQGYLSVVERGVVIPRETLDTLAALLEVPETQPTRTPEPVPLRGPLLSPKAPRHLPLRIVRWDIRPERSGDACALLAVSDLEALIVAIDVAGHGPSCYPAATYLLGWLAGRVGPAFRLDALAHAFLGELERTRLTAAFYLGALRRWSTTSHELAYEAIADGYPEPLLLCGTPTTTVQSAGRVDRDAHSATPPRPLAIAQLDPPWRLVVASDGTLATLGGGDEPEGRRALRRWQMKPERDTIPTLLREAPLSDDRTLLVVEWDGWDHEWTVTARDLDAQERILRRVLEFARARIGPSIGADRIGTATLEALANARTHAYHGTDGPIEVRIRCQSSGCTVRVDDNGRGIRRSEIATASRGLATIRAQCDAAEVRDTGHGTSVTMFVAR